MKTIINFELIDTGLQEMPKEERICRTRRWTTILHAWGTDADSALDHLCHWLQEYDYEVTPELLYAISEQWDPTADEGDGTTVFYHIYMHIGCVNPSYANTYAQHWDHEYQSLDRLKRLAEVKYAKALKAEQWCMCLGNVVAILPPLTQATVDRIRRKVLMSPLCLEIAMLEQVIAEEQRRKERVLDTMAPMVTMIPNTKAMYHVDGAFNSAPLVRFRDMLYLGYGFKTFIRKVNLQGGLYVFELWCNCPKWMYDAVCRRMSNEKA